ERAVALSPNDVAMLQLLRIIQVRLGLTERAVATLASLNRARERVESMNELMEEIAVRPDDPDLAFRLGQLAQESGMTQLASSCFEAALALDPRFQPARENLVAIRRAHPELVRDSQRQSLVPVAGRRPWPGQTHRSSAETPHSSRK